jgi:Xaa-Pro aminopeptidase
MSDFVYQRLAGHWPAANLQACLLTQASNRRYVSGFTGSSGWVVLWQPQTKAKKPLLLTDGRYTEQAGAEARGFQVQTVRQDLLSALARVFARQGITRCGFEDQAMTVSEYRRLAKLTPGVRWQGISGWVEAARAIKQPWEIACSKEAVRIANAALAKLLPRIQTGLSEKTVARLLEQNLKEAGSERLAFETIVASGQRTALPHAQPSDRRLAAGDLLLLDFGAVYQGYHSDLTRTYAVARMTGKQKELYKIVKKAQKNASKTLVSGQLSSVADKNARAVFSAHSLADYFVHSVGHGLGLDIHERPRLAKLAKEKLEVGMLVTCEPGIYLPGWGGIRIEDDIEITGQGPVFLSESSEQLEIVGTKS